MIYEHTLNEILNHVAKSEVGIIMQVWVKYNKLEDITSLLIYDLNDFTPSGTLCYYKEKVDSEVALMVPTTPLKELYSLWPYIQHLILKSEYDDDDEDFDNPLDEDNCKQKENMKFVIYHSSNATEPRQASNQKLVSFRNGIKRKETAYPTLKDEWYFDSLSRSLYITAKSHECEEVLDPECTPSTAEKDLFGEKQVFMFSVLDKHLMHSQFGRIFRTI